MWIIGGRDLLRRCVILLVLCHSVFAACKTGCSAPGSTAAKYKFQPGNVYSYDVDTYVQVQLAAEGSDSQETTLKLNGKVKIYAAKHCSYTLVIESLTSFAPDGKKTPFGGDITKPVQFTLSNDELSPELCTDAGETDFSLNIKRGIISLLQSAEGKSYETDVFGVCPTTFANFVTGGATVVTKTRDLAGCGFRETLSSSLVTSIANSKAGIKSTPLLSSTYNNQQTFKNGILDSVKLGEEYKFVAFGVDTGVAAKVTTKLTYKGTQAGTVPTIAGTGVPRTIIFENPQPDAASNAASIKQEFKDVVDSYDTNHNVGKFTVNKFTELIHLMRYSSKDDLLSLYNQVKAGTAHSNKGLGRKVFLDAVFRVGTGAAVEALADLYRNNEFPDPKEQKLLFLSLQLVTSMNSPALKASKYFLEGNPSREAYLGVGSLVNKYCQKFGCVNADVKDVTDKFLQKLGKCQPTSRKDEDIIVAVLKGVKNTNNLIQPLLEKVISCTTEKASTRVRVAALQAYPAAACNKKVITSATNYLKNVNEDSEIRIQAYLTLVECPSAAVANDIKALLDNEKVYQVGSFISTHLASLRASVDPTRYAAREHFGNIRSSNKFPFDFRRYSFNREFSYSIESLGVGASADSSVIYSQNSFLPKSWAFNFTVEAFGNNFNVFEVEGRQDNLDRVVEHYFGPKGLFSSMDMQAAYDTLIQQYGKLTDKTKQRFARGIKEDLKAFARTVNLRNDALQDFNLDVSVKFFGSELFFLSSGENVPSTPEEFLDTMLDGFDKFIQGAKKFDRVFEQHSLLIDSSLVYPTGTGLPLRLAYEEAGAGRLEASVEVDLKELVKDFKNAKFNVKTVPSYSYTSSVTLNVDALHVQTGLKLSGTMHSATGSAIKFALLDDGKAYDITIDTLFKKQELVGVHNTFAFVTRERGHPLISIPLKMEPKFKFNECFDNLYQLIGVTACVVSNMKTAPGKVMSIFSDIDLDLYLEVDPTYHFTGKYDDSDKQHQSVLLTFDTPGASKSRKTSLKLESFFKNDAYVKATILSPIRNVDATVGFNNNDKEAAFYAIAHNGPDEYSAKLGFEKQGSAARQEYLPIFTVKTPAGDAQVSKIVQTTGKIVVERVADGSTKYKLENVEWTSVYAPKTTFNGYVQQNGPSLDTDLDVVVGSSKNKVKGHLDFSPKHVNFNLDKKTEGDAKTDFRVEIEAAYSENSFKNKMAFVPGGNPANRYELNQNAEFLMENNALEELKLNNKLVLPKQSLKLDFATSKKLFLVDGEYIYDKYKVAVNVDAKYNEKTAGDYDVSVGASFNKHNFKVTTKRVVDPGKSRFQNRLTVSTGTKVELNGVVTNKFNDQEGELTIDGLFVAIDKADPYKLNMNILLTATNVDSAAKVVVGKDEFASYDLKVNRQQNANGKLTFKVKDLLEGNGEFKANKGQGDGTALISFVKQDRKLKLDTKFKIDTPTYDVTTDFYYDFGKDNTKKIHFDTKNKVTKSSFDSKNQLEVFSEKYAFNVQGQQTGQPADGTMAGKFLLTLPTGRQLSGDLKREITAPKDDKKSTGSITANLADKTPNGKRQTLSLTGTLKDGDFKARNFDMTHTLKYTDFEGKTTEAQLDTKHLPKGHFKSALVHFTLKGSFAPTQTDIAFNVEEYCEKHAVFNINAKYGAEFDGTLSGNYYLGSTEKPYTHELKATANIPNAPLKKFSFESKGTYQEPADEKGLHSLDYTGSLKYDDKQVSVSTTAKGNCNHGSGTLNVNLPQADPLSAEASYNYDDSTAGAISTKGTFKVNYGKGKSISFTGDSKAQGVDDISVHAILSTDFDQAKNVEVNFKHVKSGEAAYHTKLNVNADGKSYSVDNAIVLTETNPSVDLTIGYPENSVKLYGSYKVLNNRAFRVDAKIQNIADFNLDTNLEANYQSFETFYAKGYLDAPKLSANKVNVEVTAKPGSSGKGVEFKASSDGKSILSGYADYSVKEQGKSTVIEGQGNVKLYDKQQTVSFKLVREKLSEAGYNVLLTGAAGKNSVQTELQIKPSDFTLKTKLCGEDSKCTNVEVRSRLERKGDTFEHEAVISVELQQLGLPQTFDLKSNTKGSRLSLDHTTDVAVKEKSVPKYQYQLYIHPNSAGARLILPTRTLAAEAVFKYPNDKFGEYDSTVSFYLDQKNAPKNKITFGFTGETKMVGSAGVTGNGKLKFSHPTIKDLVVSATGTIDGERQAVSGSAELDVFKNPSDKVVAQFKYENSDQSFKGYNISSDVSIASKGLGFECRFNGHSALSFPARTFSTAGDLYLPFEDFRFGTYAFANPEGFDFLLRRFNTELVRAHGEYEPKKNKASFTSTIKFVPTRPVIVTSQLNGLTSAQFSLKQADFFAIDGAFTVDKEASLKVLGVNKELLNAKVALDASHFLATEYKVNEANAKDFFQQFNNEIQKDIQAAKAELEQKYAQITADVTKLGNRFIEALPDFSKLQADYANQLQKLQEELLQDPYVRQLFDFLVKLYAAFNDIFNQVSQVYLENIQKVSAILGELGSSLMQTFNKDILPILQQFYGQIESVFLNIYEETLKLLSAVLERTVKALKVFEEDFNKVASTLTEAFRNFAQSFSKAISTLDKELRDLYKLLQEYFESFDEFKHVKETLKEYFDGADRYAYQLLRELLTLLEDVIPDPTIKEFTSAVNKYVTAKLNNEKINDVEEVKQIFLNLFKVLTSLFEKIIYGGAEVQDPSTTLFGVLEQLPTFTTFKLLPFVTSIQFSPWNYLRNEKFVSVRDFLYQFRPYAWNPMDVLPPFQMHGQLADGEHYFTFDGEHFTFPGSCQYVIASDFADGNFSIVANIDKGVLKSISLIDKDILELNNQGVVSLNGKPTDLPIHKNDIHAWRRFYTVNLLTTYGASVMCTTDLKVCHFTVSGFYLGKIRGLLGNGNNEPHDDYILPNGKQAAGSAEFANSYSASKSCAAVADPKHDTHDHSGTNAYCSKLFNTDSSLRMCYFFKDPSNYREACEHATHGNADPTGAACQIAFAYASACRLEMIPVNVPAECQKCSVGTAKQDVGDQYSVKSPQKQADVVFVVDTALGPLLGELVQGTIFELRKDLKTAGITDTRVVVLGFNRNQKYVSLFSTGGNLDYTGKLGQADTKGPENCKPLVTNIETVDSFFKTLHNIQETILEDLALTTDARAFVQALEYPFRASASKSIVIFHSDDSEKNPNPARALKSLLATLDLKSKGIGLHVVTPVKNLAIAKTKDASKLKEIVGFNAKHVFTLADSKKRTNVGSTELKNNLKYESDLLVDMVQQNDGYVFALQNYKGLKQTKDKKSYVTLISTLLSDYLSRTEVASDCVCTLKYGLHPESSCEAKETKYLPPAKKSAGARG